MKIGIASFASAFLEFHLNIAKRLETLGHQVYFLNPDKFIEKQLRKYGLNVESFPATQNRVSFYTEDSDLIKYYTRLYQLKNSAPLIKNRDIEYSKCLKYFEQNPDFDMILFWNGAGNVENDACQKLNIKTFHFENGYFPNTFQMNRRGVNCNAEYANLQLDDFLNFKYPSINYSPDKIHSPIILSTRLFERYFYRLFDSKFNIIIKEAFLYNKRLKKAKQRFIQLPVDELELSQMGKYIFFPLQVNSDTQIILNSPYSSMYDALKQILPKLKETGYKILLKEHPFEVETVNYSPFIDNENVFLIKKYDINELIEKSEFVVNINSSVGLQSIENYKKVLLLGESLYDHAPSSVRYDENESILKTLEIVEADKKLTDCYINHFKKEIFIEGDWKKLTPEFLNKVIDRIIAT